MPVFHLFYLDTVTQILLSQLSLYSHCPAIDSYSTWIESRLSIQTCLKESVTCWAKSLKYMEIKQYSNITFKINICTWSTWLANALLRFSIQGNPIHTSLHIFMDYNDGHAYELTGFYLESKTIFQTGFFWCTAIQRAERTSNKGWRRQLALEKLEKYENVGQKSNNSDSKSEINRYYKQTML